MSFSFLFAVLFLWSEPDTFIKPQNWWQNSISEIYLKIMHIGIISLETAILFYFSHREGNYHCAEYYQQPFKTWLIFISVSAKFCLKRLGQCLVKSSIKSLTPSFLIKRNRLASLSAKIISFGINFNYILDKDRLEYLKGCLKDRRSRDEPVCSGS